mgnify:CR=1 FL=1
MSSNKACDLSSFRCRGARCCQYMQVNAANQAFNHMAATSESSCRLGPGFGDVRTVRQHVVPTAYC